MCKLKLVDSRGNNSRDKAHNINAVYVESLPAQSIQKIIPK